MDYKGAKVQGAVSTAIRKLLELLQDLIYKRDFQEAALVFCALALHYRSIPEVIWKVRVTKTISIFSYFSPNCVCSLFFRVASRFYGINLMLFLSKEFYFTVK
jgi:hypothetical protein